MQSESGRVADATPEEDAIRNEFRELDDGTSGLALRLVDRRPGEHRGAQHE